MTQRACVLQESALAGHPLLSTRTYDPPEAVDHNRNLPAPQEVTEILQVSIVDHMTAVAGTLEDTEEDFAPLSRKYAYRSFLNLGASS